MDTLINIIYELSLIDAPPSDTYYIFEGMTLENFKMNLLDIQAIQAGLKDKIKSRSRSVAIVVSRAYEENFNRIYDMLPFECKVYCATCLIPNSMIDNKTELIYKPTSAESRVKSSLIMTELIELVGKSKSVKFFYPYDTDESLYV